MILEDIKENFYSSFIHGLIPLVPQYIMPNHITIFNAFLMIVFTVYTFHLTSFTGAIKSWGFIICTLLNFTSMTLDCLDGALARLKKQCSKTGALLDHWCDSCNVILLSVCCINLLDIYSNGTFLYMSTLTPTSIVFNFQLLHMLFTKQDVSVPGETCQASNRIKKTSFNRFFEIY